MMSGDSRHTVRVQHYVNLRNLTYASGIGNVIGFPCLDFL